MHAVIEHLWGERLLSVERAPTRHQAGLRVDDHGGVALVHLLPGMDVRVSDAEGTRGLVQLQRDGTLDGAALRVQPGQEAWVDDGRVRYRVRFVDDVRLEVAPWTERVDTRWFKAVSMTIMAAAALVAILQLGVVRGEDEDAFFGLKPLSVAAAIVPQVVKKPAVELTERIASVMRATAASSVARLTPKPAGGGGAGAAERLLSQIFEGGGLGGPGLNAAVQGALDALRSNGPAGDPGGLGGVGARGSLAGPGDLNGLGLGGLGVDRRGRRPGGGEIGFGGGKKLDVAPCKDGCKTVVDGGMSKDVIAKVIQRHMGEIRFCYESALQHAPGLAGKVAVQFTIDPSGTVADAQVAESSLGHGGVERCIVERVGRWKFPEPPNGGVVSVTYPWLLRTAGSDDE